MGMFLPMQSDIFVDIIVICDVYVYLHATWLAVGPAPWYPFKYIHSVMCWNSEKNIYI